MKTKEFIEKVELLDLRVEKINDTILVGDINRYYCCLSKVEQYELEIFQDHFEKLEEDVRHKLLDVIIEYIKTPLEERKEPKKYYLRLPDYLYESSSYLNYNTIDKTYCFFGGFGLGELQTQFTQEEIDNLPNQEFIKTLIKEEV